MEQRTYGTDPWQHHPPAACSKSQSQPEAAPAQQGAKSPEGAIMHPFPCLPKPVLPQTSHFIFK